MLSQLLVTLEGEKEVAGWQARMGDADVETLQNRELVEHTEEMELGILGESGREA